MTSKSSSEQLIPLTAMAADESTEVFVSDGRFRRIASGVGRVEVDVPAGIYKVRFRSGDEQHDELVEVRPDDVTKDVMGPPVQFRSAVPIKDTETADATHATAAERASRSKPLSFGSGSGLFLFSRELREKERTRPWTGVSVRDVAGNRIADLAEGTCSRKHRYGTLHLEVDPGTYRLRVETGIVGTYEMFVVTAPGWQTQVFTISDDFWAGEQRVRRPGLRSAAVFMTEGDTGFRKDSEQARLTELARQGLRNARVVVPPGDVHTMVWAKYRNPMLSIYGAHLMLLGQRINQEYLSRVMHNLTNIVGAHPDVLALLLRSGAPTPPPDLSFATPPMLRSSWDLVTRATRRRRNLVPAKSISDTIADELIDSRPWLLHRVDRPAVTAAEPVSFAEAKRLLDGLMERASAGQARSLTAMILDKRDAFSSLEQSIASAALGGALLEADADWDTAASAAKVLRNLDAPATSIARSTNSLVQKLEDFS